MGKTMPHERLTHGLRRRLLATTVMAVALLILPKSAGAQFGFSAPSAQYLGSLSTYYDGDYRDALLEFQSAGRGGIRAGTTRWIDSICYYTMVGECYYQMGQHQQALAQYNSALSIYSAFNNWMMQVQFPALRTANVGQFRPLPWGRSARAVVLGNYPDMYGIMQGQFTNLQNLVAQGGGVASAPMQTMIHATEIIRCTCLAMRRRRELMGPACAQDQLTNDLITEFSRRPGHPNHWSECWIDLQLGIAFSCGGKDAQAKTSLERAVLAAGEFDHPLTGMAFFELGRLALQASDYDAATNYFTEATYSAALYLDPTTLEEAFRYGQITHLMANRPGLYPPLTAATLWARANNLRHLNVSTQILAAENYCILEQPQTALGLLNTAGTSIGRRGMAMGKVGARLNFISALAAYQQSNVELGDQKLAQAMAFQKNGSLKLFHISLADALYTDGTFSPRVAMDLYGEVLRDPTPGDWASDPMEALSVMMTPHELEYEHWFEVAVDRKDHERVLEISDLARRHRFLSTLDFGGRLHNLRWLLDGPEDNLDQASRLQRQDLLARYSDYEKLHQAAEKLHGALKQSPLVAENAEAGHQQANKLAALTETSNSQELILRQMAVRREPCNLIFPPFRATKDIKAALPDGHAILSFFSTPRQAYAILMTRDKYGYWKVPRGDQLIKPVMKLLQSMGSVDGNRQMTLKDLNASNWKEPAKQIFDAITKDSRADLKSFKELVIVPDGALWYLPFEALPVTVGEEQVPLMTQVQIRYAPLVSLGVGDPRPRRAGGNTAVVLGKLMLGGDSEQASEAYTEISKTLPGAVALHSPMPKDLPAYATLFDGLIVLNEVPVSEDDPYDWSPLPQDQKGTGTVANWFALPWGGPDFVIMPSFHTAAENAMKKQTGQPGNEVFLSVCALMANGARTVLLSRWRTGGQSSIDLVREFAQELPHASAADAWQRSLLLVSKDALNPANEPRLRLTAHEEAPTADHPFFWAGYLLADTGTLPQELADKQRQEQADNQAAEKPAGAKRPANDKAPDKNAAGAGAPAAAAGGLAPFPSVGGPNAAGQGAAGKGAGAPKQSDAQQQPGAMQQPGGFQPPNGFQQPNGQQPSGQQPANGGGAFQRARPNAAPDAGGGPNAGTNDKGGTGQPGLGGQAGPMQDESDDSTSKPQAKGKPARKTKAPKTPKAPRSRETEKEEIVPTSPWADEDKAADPSVAKSTNKRQRTKTPANGKKTGGAKSPKYDDNGDPIPPGSP
ncbi:MAG TPA: CHAT domain-containing protein [Pirellulales bacterium]